MPSSVHTNNAAKAPAELADRENMPHTKHTKMPGLKYAGGFCTMTNSWSPSAGSTGSHSSASAAMATTEHRPTHNSWRSDARGWHTGRYTSRVKMVALELKTLASDDIRDAITAAISSPCVWRGSTRPMSHGWVG